MCHGDGQSRQTIKEANISGYAVEADTYEQTADTAVEASRIATLIGRQSASAAYRVILEIGGGTGHGTEVIRHLAHGAFHIVSDISPAMLTICRGRLPGVALVVCDAEHLPFRDGAIDMVICASFLHHLPDDEMVCAETARVLSVGGAFVGIREPNRAGADHFFRLKHLGRRYATRTGVALLMRRLVAGPKGWRQVYSYEGMSEDDFLRMDRQEIRGAVLHATPTKERGGIDIQKFLRTARVHYTSVRVLPFGLLAACVEAAQYWFGGRRDQTLAARIARAVDSALGRIAKRFAFDSWSFCCRK